MILMSPALHSDCTFASSLHTDDPCLIPHSCVLRFDQTAAGKALKKLDAAMASNPLLKAYYDDAKQQMEQAAKDRLDEIVKVVTTNLTCMHYYHQIQPCSIIHHRYSNEDSPPYN